MDEVNVGPRRALWLLAEAVAVVATAGDQGVLRLELLSPTHEPNKVVEVSRETSEVEAGEFRWRGPLGEWQAAVLEAATRPPCPPKGWAPGPYEAAAFPWRVEGAARSREDWNDAEGEEAGA